MKLPFDSKCQTYLEWQVGELGPLSADIWFFIPEMSDHRSVKHRGMLWIGHLPLSPEKPNDHNVSHRQSIQGKVARESIGTGRFRLILRSLRSKYVFYLFSMVRWGWKSKSYFHRIVRRNIIPFHQLERPFGHQIWAIETYIHFRNSMSCNRADYCHILCSSHLPLLHKEPQRIPEKDLAPLTFTLTRKSTLSFLLLR
jgi:hypothetical protein